MGRPDALPELVARSADRSRQSAAVRQGESVVTYGDLQALAVQLAAEKRAAPPRTPRPPRARGGLSP